MDGGRSPDATGEPCPSRDNLDGRGRLLDVGCGTGYVCLPLSRWFEDVVAVDPEPDMLRLAAHAAGSQGVDNIRFLNQRAEDVSQSLAPLRLVTFGNSFHWTDRARVAHALFPLIARGGGLVALVSSSVCYGEQPWKVAVRDTINAWAGQGQRARTSRLAGCRSMRRYSARRPSASRARPPS